MARLHRFTAIAGALGCVLASPPVRLARAQSLGQRTVLEAWRDSLDRVPDAAPLERMEARLVREVGRRPTDAFGHLKLGFINLRLARLGGERRLEDAAIEFQTAARLAPAWPYGWYGLGLAEVELYPSGQGAATTAGNRPEAAAGFRRAAAAFQRTALADPRFAAVLVEEAGIGRRQRQPARSAIVLAALRWAALAQPADPLVLRGLGEVEREFGDPAAALRAFDAALARSGGARGLALLEVARTRLAIGRGDGVGPYFDGATLDDSATVDGYRSDLVPIASEAELEGFDEVHGRARAEFLRRFWFARDAGEFRPQGSRLVEHYRRWYEALRRFPRYDPMPVRAAAGVRIAFEGQVEDRGLVFLRHGDPDDRVALSTIGFEPNESWRYVRAEGDLVLHFVARHGPGDYHLVESLFDVSKLPGGARAPRAEAPAGQGEAQLVRSREALSPLYRLGGEAAVARDRQFRIAERAMSRSSQVRAMTTDDFRPRYSRRLDARADLVVLGRDDGHARVHLALAVPFAAAGVAWLGEGIAFPLRLRLVALDPAGVKVAGLDSTVRAVAVAHQGQRWLTATLALPLPAGRLRVRVLVEDGERGGTLLPFRALEVNAFDGAMAVSDLALGPRGGPWAVELGAEPVWLDPLARLTRDREAEIAYEVRGRAGAEVTCQMTVIRTDERPGVAYTDAWRAALRGPSTVLRHPLNLARLKPGLYRLEVTVTDGTGRLVRRWREVEVAP